MIHDTVAYIIFINRMIYLGYETVASVNPAFYDDVVTKANMSEDISAEGNMFKI